MFLPTCVAHTNHDEAISFLFCLPTLIGGAPCRDGFSMNVVTQRKNFSQKRKERENALVFLPLSPGNLTGHFFPNLLWLNEGWEIKFAFAFCCNTFLSLSLLNCAKGGNYRGASEEGMLQISSSFPQRDRCLRELINARKKVFYSGGKEFPDTRVNCETSRPIFLFSFGKICGKWFGVSVDISKVWRIRRLTFFFHFSQRVYVSIWSNPWQRGRSS